VCQEQTRSWWTQDLSVLHGTFLRRYDADLAAWMPASSSPPSPPSSKPISRTVTLLVVTPRRGMLCCCCPFLESYVLAGLTASTAASSLSNLQVAQEHAGSYAGTSRSAGSSICQRHRRWCRNLNVLT